MMMLADAGLGAESGLKLWMCVCVRAGWGVWRVRVFKRY